MENRVNYGSCLPLTSSVPRPFSPTIIEFSGFLPFFPSLPLLTGPDNSLVREALLHGEGRLQVRLLLPLHPADRASHSGASRQNFHKVSLT